MAEKGIKLVTYDLSPLQVALIEWGKSHPYGRIKEITFQDGIPVEALVYSEDGIGTELVRFDKLARKAGLL